jgi:hypothetical protein
MTLPRLPKPILIAAGVLVGLLLLALVVGLLRPAGPSAPDAAPTTPAPTIPQQYPSAGTSLPTAPPAGPRAAAAPSASVPAAPAWPARYPPSTPVERGAVETVELAPDAFTPKYSTLTRRTIGGAVTSIDGAAARQNAALTDVQGVRVTRSGLIRVEAESEYTITLGLDAPGRLWTSRGECTAALNGVPIIRLSGTQELVPNSGVLAAGLHELTFGCSLMTGKWVATVSLREAQAERPSVAALYLPEEIIEPAEAPPQPAQAEADPIEADETSPGT